MVNLTRNNELKNLTNSNRYCYIFKSKLFVNNVYCGVLKEKDKKEEGEGEGEELNIIPDPREIKKAEIEESFYLELFYYETGKPIIGGIKGLTDKLANNLVEEFLNRKEKEEFELIH